MVVEIRVWLFVLMCIPAFFGVIILSIITAAIIDKIKESWQKRSSSIERKIFKLQEEKEEIDNHIMHLDGILAKRIREKNSKN